MIWNYKILLAVFMFSIMMMPLSQAQKELNDTEKISAIENDTKEIVKITDEIKLLVDRILKTTDFKVSIGATAYAIGDEANLHAKVFEASASESINDGFCDYQIFFPNNTLFTAGELNIIPNSRGVYSDNFTIPNITGVYPVDVECVRPVNETSQIHHLSQEGTGNISALRFDNVTGVVLNQITVFNIDVDSGILCSIARFSEIQDDFDDGKFEEIRFLDNITDISIWFSNQNPFNEYTIILKWFKRTTTGEVLMGTSINQSVTVLNPPDDTQVFFPNTAIQFPFEKFSVLELELCFRKLSGPFGDIAIMFNDTTRDSQFNVNSRTVDAPVDFRVGGSSELAVTTIGFGQSQNINASLGSAIDEIEDLINAHNQSNENEFFNLNISENVFFNNLQTLILGHDTNQTNINITLNSRFDSVDSFLSVFRLDVVNFFASLDIGIIGNTTLINQNIEDHDLNIANNFTFTNNLLTSHDLNLTVKINGIDVAIGNNFTSTNALINAVNNSVFEKMIGLMEEHNSLDSALSGNFSTTNTLLTNNFNSLDQSLDGNITNVISEINQVDFEVWDFPTRTLTELNLTNITLVGNFSMSNQNIDDIARGVYNFFFRADALPEQEEDIGIFGGIFG